MIGLRTYSSVSYWPRDKEANFPWCSWRIVVALNYHLLCVCVCVCGRGVIRVDVNIQDMDLDQCSQGDGWFADTHQCNRTSMEVKNLLWQTEFPQPACFPQVGRGSADSGCYFRLTSGASADGGEGAGLSLPLN